jgi:hypothetical protein
VGVARVGIAVFLFFLGTIGVVAGLSLLGGENEDLTETGERVVGALWLFSAALYTFAAVLVLRRSMSGRLLGALVAVLVLGGVVLTLNPYLGAPVSAIAVLVAIFAFR